MHNLFESTDASKNAKWGILLFDIGSAIIAFICAAQTKKALYLYIGLAYLAIAVASFFDPTPSLASNQADLKTKNVQQLLKALLFIGSIVIIASLILSLFIA